MQLDRRLHLVVLALASGLSHSAAAQEPAPPQAAPPGATVLQAGTQLVIVDVVVQDHNGRPIHGLKPENFHLTEDKAAQTLRRFEEHTATSAPTMPVPPLKLPPGTFTNYTPVPPNGTLNVLLLDTLNTPTKDQSFVRTQLQEYVKHARPGTRLAIFGLTTHLVFLQGFTSDPEILKDAVDHKLIPRGSVLLDDPSGANGVSETLSDQLADSAAELPAGNGLAQVAANVAQFEAQTAAFQTQLRIQYTLDAFNTLGHYLAAFPGRKNLIWFSGAFPINILPDPSLQDPFAVIQTNEDEYRETTALLSKAQVSVYPIDARGLMTNPLYDAASTGRNYARNPQRLSADINKFNTSQAAEHSTMAALASDTGGQAFYNTNGLAEAVGKAIDAGSNYYTLTYTPTDRRKNGAFRSIHIDLTGTDSATLSYRRGYYTDDAKALERAAEKPPARSDKQDAAATVLAALSPAERAADAYARAAMARGAPTPQDILLKARILPETATTDTTLAPGNTLDTSVAANGPFRRYVIDVVALPSELTLITQPDGRRTGQVEFIAYVFNQPGLLLNATGKTISLNLTPETYARFTHSTMQARLEISVPTRYETFIRVGIRDVSANRFGVLEVPVATLSRLAPLPSAPPSAPPTSTPPAATPSTPPAP
jgi:VWFA-related protein